MLRLDILQQENRELQKCFRITNGNDSAEEDEEVAKFHKDFGDFHKAEPRKVLALGIDSLSQLCYFIAWEPDI